MTTLNSKPMTKEQEEYFNSILKGCEHDGSYIPVGEVKKLMREIHNNAVDQCAKSAYEELFSKGISFDKEPILKNKIQ